MIKYSFILPTITISNLFIKALDNLVNQNFNYRYEIIIIIDNPNLPIAEGIKNLFPSFLRDKTIRIFKNKKNYGLTKTLNIGILKAKGEYIVRNDEDDYSNLDRLSEIHKVIKKNKKIKFISSDFNFKLNNFLIPKNLKYKNNNIAGVLKFKNPFAHSSICFNRAFFIKAGLYNETLKVSQDYELWSRFIRLQKNSYFHIKKILVTININDSTISRRFSKNQKINSVLIALQNNFLDSLKYTNFEKPKFIINNILKLESQLFKNQKSMLNALLFCYLYDYKNEFKLKYNIRTILYIFLIYLKYPNLLLKRLF